MLHERSTTNNRSRRTVVIDGSKNHRTVQVAQVGIIEEPPVELPDDDLADERHG